MRNAMRRRRRRDATVDAQAAQADELSVAQPILDRELHAAADVLETANRIELL
jgi:uncharacterized protein (DUF1778 family)